MKLFQRLLLLALISGVLFSCEQEQLKLEEETLDVSALTRADIEQLHKAYIERHGRDVVIEYTTLEELNATYEAQGLPKVTLDELGLTIAQYEAAQARIKQIKEGTAVESRCSDPVYLFLGDMNDNGVLSSFDYFLAARVINMLDPETTNSYLFGLVSSYAMNVSSTLTICDVDLIRLVILGIPCDDIEIPFDDCL